ncbi:TPA: diguanylate cyclase DgcN [Escherichia coli]|uniref:diguanylate cyclase DgcN n=1 Tax=Escherichia coli TaxID=562 RepID=UPI001E30A7C6|nr:diguanylate cyclase DgcN [Escherichia coli]MCD6763523.1 diguanylate cyclase DgcN [Escherichia coli]MCT9832197.1 diguanylate cyclase DgcN [Escherichia coli]HBP7861085.1 diguanylate cyclase DgcN [Escherichia coli]
MMDNDNSLNKRPTFKRALRNISMTSIFITMMLIWLLLSVTSVLTLKQYAQKNLALTAATMTYSLEAAVVFADGPAATETLAALGQQGQFSTAEVRDKQQNILASWHYTRKDPGDTFSNFISHWLFPAPIIQPIRHNGETIGEVRLTARDSSISHFIWFSLAVLTGCILLASGIAITLTRHLHNGLVEALKNITDVVHDVRSNRNFSRRVSEERIAEFHRFALEQICSALTQIFNLPFDLHNGHQTTMTLSIGYAMTIEHASAEKLQELADHNMYQAKHQRAEKLVR